MKAGRRLVIALGLAAACLAATLAMPVQIWRTGRLAVRPLTLSVAGDDAAHGPLWIDTDAACGHTPRTDVDDCLALWLLARHGQIAIAGVSTVFGNAAVDVTHRTTSDLAALLWPASSDGVDVYRGAAHPAAAPYTEAHVALGRALERGPMTILALGPLTNVAHLLSARPQLTRNVQQVVAVMGRRIGHLFHPSEGAGRGAFLGHGPVFRDFNFSMDPGAVRLLVEARVPMTFVPYDAATAVEITNEHLARLRAHDDAGAWIALRSDGWLGYWQTQIGRAGFYPFDTMAAAYVIAPGLFRCASVRAWVGRDPLLFLPLFRPEGLLVEANSEKRNARYCPAVTARFDDALRDWLFAGSRSAGASGVLSGARPRGTAGPLRASDQVRSDDARENLRSRGPGARLTRRRVGVFESGEPEPASSRFRRRRGRRTLRRPNLGCRDDSSRGRQPARPQPAVSHRHTARR